MGSVWRLWVGVAIVKIPGWVPASGPAIPCLQLVSDVFHHEEQVDVGRAMNIMSFRIATMCILVIMGEAAALATGMTTRPLVLGYYPSWKSGLEPSQINYARFTHLCHAFVMPDTSGTLRMEGNMPSRELTGRAHEKGVQVLVSLGGADSGTSFGAIVRDPASEDAFVRNVVKLARDNGYDGVDLDWEFPRDELEMHGCTRLARRFREEFGRTGGRGVVTAAFSGTAWAGKWIDHKAMLEYLDFINVMTYDMHGPWSEHAGPNAALVAEAEDPSGCRANSVTGQMLYWTGTKRWPADRLLVGVPCYGRGFAVEKWYSLLQKGVNARYSYLAFNKLPEMTADGWVRSWNSETSTPQLAKQGVRELISYEDEESARIKGGWASQAGFGGVFFWEISQDFVAGDHVIVKAAREGFEAGRK